RKFYRKYQEVDSSQVETVFLDGVRRTPRALTTAYRSLHPSATEAELAGILRRRLEETAPNDKQIASLYEEYAPDRYGLADQGYLAGVHPLELWLVGYRLEHPGAGITQILADSRNERQQVYTWLFKTKRKDAQDARIRSLLEVEAFLEIQRSWARLGYPFANLVPSYATSIGSSGDRPAALADLMGIILNDGVRRPNVRVVDLRFASGTPFETDLERVPDAGQQVMDPAVARRLREELVGVVSFGTARRAFQSVTLDDGTIVPVGGKTGTGDNRIKITAPGGQRVAAKVMNRTASFVFLVGDRFFGTIVAYVPGEQARNYNFTSALPVQCWKTLAPRLHTLFQSPPQTDAMVPMDTTSVGADSVGTVGAAAVETDSSGTGTGAASGPPSATSIPVALDAIPAGSDPLDAAHEGGSPQGR
ncbi:MAG: hypothetical protein KC729_21250, partial [Candidatus Eisenbacteria bacterium]|nr:hypothetical protein [Candidatus Eisenbacteria bacterium]